MERQRIAQALADHGFRKSGNAFYGAVDGYPVIAALQGKDQIRAVTAAFTVRKLPTGGQRKALLQALKAQATVNQAQGKTAALTWQEKKGYRLEEIMDLLQAAAGTLKNHGAAEPEDQCIICGQDGCDGYIRYDGRYEVIHQRCISRMKAEAQQQAAANQGSYVLGIVGALVGGLVGMIPTVLSILSSGFEILFEKSPKRRVVRKVNQATSASCKAIASFAIRAFTSSSCVCFAFSAGIALTTKIVPPIFSTKPVFISSTVITPLRKNRGVRFRTPRYQTKKDYSFS